jgi:hypothetical protein
MIVEIVGAIGLVVMLLCYMKKAPECPKLGIRSDCCTNKGS